VGLKSFVLQPMNMNEIVIFVTERQSMFRAVLLLEEHGYDVTDVLPILRTIIVKLTPEQLVQVQENRGKLWKNDLLGSNKKTRR
jgi:hypothetical protein